MYINALEMVDHYIGLLLPEIRDFLYGMAEISDTFM